jgi:hypothetical protein
MINTPRLSAIELTPLRITKPGKLAAGQPLPRICQLLGERAAIEPEGRKKRG